MLLKLYSTSALPLPCFPPFFSLTHHLVFVSSIGTFGAFPRIDIQPLIALFLQESILSLSLPYKESTLQATD